MKKKTGLYDFSRFPKSLRKKLEGAPDIITNDFLHVSQFNLKCERISGKSTSWHFVIPANQDEILNRYIHEPELHAPYWAEIWPAGMVMMNFLENNVYLTHKRVLELGSGLGISGMAVRSLGGYLYYTDIDKLSLRFCRVNHYLNYQEVADVILFDWKNPPLNNGFDYIIASDVAYQKNDYEVLYNCLKLLSGPNVTILLTEPGRSFAQTFIKKILQLGKIVRNDIINYEMDGKNLKIQLLEITARTT